MTSLPLVPNHNIFNKHTHSRITILNSERGGSKDTSFLYSPLQVMHNLLEVFSFENFETKYKMDSDANTEYLTLKGKVFKGSDVDIHIFSCYCEGDVEGPPPF